MKAQRDVFLEELLIHAKKDSRIILITVDMGAPALDLWRDELPNQVISAGISEQNAINVAAGLRASGKIPYVYFMACWAARCLEQIRYSCAMAQNPITILGNGVGLGYAPAGPAHEPTDDLTYMASIDGIEICSPSNNYQISELVKITIDLPALRYVRLERSISETVDQLSEKSWKNRVDNNLHVLYQSKNVNNSLLSIISSGYLLDRALKLALELEKIKNIGVSVVDLHTLPIDSNNNYFASHLSASSHIATLEEQGPNAGFSSQILKFMVQKNILRPFHIATLDKTYIFENGTREQLLNSNGFNFQFLLNMFKRLNIN